ncbi:uncharacterized protein LOC133662328 isoform X1 [Entelurus aequoreus]|uniref:uncharacterized protein LOC133662328 isoform X1 n=1 Tax=Entelurus aequoreus TaxID=161455 RepID=UPI002B1D7591|nr:uncharacterized protein LOC133662328 isoform X1 [Entelurus aequoreus]
MLRALSIRGRHASATTVGEKKRRKIPPHGAPPPFNTRCQNGQNCQVPREEKREKKRRRNEKKTEVAGAKSEDPLSPDYVPSIFEHTQSPHKRKLKCSMKIFERRQNLKQRKRDRERALAAAAALVNISQSVPCENDQLPAGEDVVHAEIRKEGMGTTATQTDITGEAIDSLTAECNNLRAELDEPKDSLKRCTWNEESFKGNDDKVTFLTGLPSYMIMMTTFNFIAPHLSQNMKLSPFSQFLVTLLRLRLNLCL